jgi:glycosyltransferase involved in cell wall biosynthesis
LLRKKELDGIGNFVKEGFSRIIADHPEVEFLLMCDKGFAENYFDFPNVKKYHIFPALRHPLLYVFYMELIVPVFLKKHKPDLFIGPEGILSLSSQCRQLACVHDLNFLHYPENLNFRNRVYYNFFVPRFIRKSARIAVVSDYTRKDIIKSYNVNPEKIDIVYSGIKTNLEPLVTSEIYDIRREHTGGCPYFFFVGSLHPRKNLVRLMQAFDLFKEQIPSDIKLVLAGNFMWKNDAIVDTYSQLKHKNEIIFTGHVSDQLLAKLYAAALCVTFVPVFEGFGLPIVEAFAAGVPLICSNVTSMPEIAGDAALLVDPFDVEKVKDAMVRIYNNEDNIRAKLVERGNRQKELFSWQKTAEKLWQTIKQSIDGV